MADGFFDTYDAFSGIVNGIYASLNRFSGSRRGSGIVRRMWRGMTRTLMEKSEPVRA